VDEFCLRNGEGKIHGCRNTAKGAEVALEELNVASVGGGGGDRDHQIVNVGDHNAFGDHRVKRGNINDEKGRGDEGALGATDRDWRENPWGPLEEQFAHEVREETADPCGEVFVGPFRL